MNDNRFRRFFCLVERETAFMKYGYGYGLRLVIFVIADCDSREGCVVCMCIGMGTICIWGLGPGLGLCVGFTFRCARRS